MPREGQGDRSCQRLCRSEIGVVQDPRWVSFMYSYANLIPLQAATIRRIVSAVESFEFEQIYGAWWTKVVATDAKTTVRRSADQPMSSGMGFPWSMMGVGRPLKSRRVIFDALMPRW